MCIFKFTISVMVGHCDYMPRAPETYLCHCASL